MSADLLLDFPQWQAATEGISVGAKGLLIRLIVRAADAGCCAIPVRDANNPDLRFQDRGTFKARFAELRLRGLIYEVEPGVYEIAPTLWKLGLHRRDEPYIKLR
jgi:hypothetical protein